MELIGGIFITDIIIFAALVAVFVYLSRRAWLTREITGYGLGCLVGLFFVVIYTSLVPSATIDPTLTNRVALSFFQLALPTGCGIFVGIGLLLFFAWARNFPRRYTILISTITALNLILLFLMLVADTNSRRMIGIFSLAFIISGVATAVLFGRGDAQQSVGYAQSLGIQADGTMPPPPQPQISPLEQMRSRFRR